MYICREDGQVQALATHHNVDVHICDKPVFYGKNSFFIIIFFLSFVVAHVFSATALRVNDIAQNMHTLNFLFRNLFVFFFVFATETSTLSRRCVALVDSVLDLASCAAATSIFDFVIFCDPLGLHLHVYMCFLIPLLAKVKCRHR